MAALAITEKIEGTIKVDVSDPAFADAGKIPLLKVPTALESDADNALDVSDRPAGWMLKKIVCHLIDREKPSKHILFRKDQTV